MAAASSTGGKFIERPVTSWVIIGACIALGFVDMVILSSAMAELFELASSSASVIALVVSVVGSATALLWGRAEAGDSESRWYKAHEFWIWLAIGVVLIAIRVAAAFINGEGLEDELTQHIMSEVLMATILSILYIGAGMAIRGESRKVFDKERYSEWNEFKEAKGLQNSIAKKYAEAGRIVIELESFHHYYQALDKQYSIRQHALEDAERGTMSHVVKRVLEDNPHLSAQVVDDILQAVVSERANRNS